MLHLQWIIPKEIYVAFGQLQKQGKQMEQVLTRILIAKGQICYKSKVFEVCFSRKLKLIYLLRLNYSRQVHLKFYS